MHSRKKRISITISSICRTVLRDEPPGNGGRVLTLRGFICILGGMKKVKIVRPGWDEYFMDIAQVVARRSNCLRRAVAAVLVKDSRIISTGYNGTPRGVKNCFEGSCARCSGEAVSGADLGECICSHAEENAITQAAYHGIATAGSTLYCTLSPCLICSRMIINAGVTEVVYENPYEFNAQAKRLLRAAGLKIRKFERAGKGVVRSTQGGRRTK